MIEALSASIEHDKAHPSLYRDARGHEWNGRGDMPDWLLAAKNAGVNPEFFRIETAPDATTPVAKQPATIPWLIPDSSTFSTLRDRRATARRISMRILILADKVCYDIPA
ncbi:hypothetical protein WQE_20246 [Paraburkholderia hospita]|uniref:DNA-binding protein H-NS-like C-terminal domain-containing protein n=1 Tax=Paraburkholderia hospita TaxID=169430 RepID=A0ABP2PNF4_9BURK|nr:hypothetical protein [Paraburkholderia hospita]EIM99215.1 hypothetical protein WQE_20246 [Paraburkholderia hospita]OUL72498.1 hypothetical protein CA602_43470 [Paraburkholderia hospita]